jgi:hypothetical protein
MKHKPFQNQQRNTYGTGCWTTTGDASGATGVSVGTLKKKKDDDDKQEKENLS